MSSTDSEQAPEVSIVLPYHNRSDLTGPCLASLARYTDPRRAELILVDDASTESFDPQIHLGDVPFTLLRNERRRSYSENNNAAAARARGEYLLLLNNDTLVTPGWLDGLMAVARAESRLGALGNKHLFPDSGRIQHTGMAFREDGRPLHLHPGAAPEDPAVNYQREVSCVTFACVLIPTAVFRELGGLDEGYRNGCEDVDFCLRARAAGYRIIYTPAGAIYHYGQSTVGRTDADDENLRRLAERWRGKLPNDLAARLEEDRAFNARCAVVPRRRKTAPGVHLAVDLGRGSAFTWATAELALALHRREVPVSLPRGPLATSIPAATSRRLRSLQRTDPRTDYQVRWTHYWPECWRQTLSGEVNAEFFCTNYRYRPDTPFLDPWMRHVRLNGFRKFPVARFNLDALRDVGISSDACAVVPLGYAPEIEDVDPGASRLPGSGGADLQMLLVTNSCDLPRYGTDLAVAALGRAYGPSDPVVVHIRDYGAGVTSELRDLIARQPRFPRVVWHTTFLPKTELMRLYAGMDVQLAPFRGEGFAMKVLDAMALGVPTMMPLFGGPTEFADADTCWALPYREAPVGDCYDRRNFYLGEGAWWAEPDVDAITDALRALPDSRRRLVDLGARARAAVRGRFTWDAAADRFWDVLRGWDVERRVTLSRRAAPDEKMLTVVIPTFDRPDALRKSLPAYRRQTLPAKDYEILLVNDHGTPDPLRRAVEDFSNLPIRLLENTTGARGPGAARNVGIEQARGGVVLITGDDIVPEPEFLEAHLGGHRAHPALEDAVLGLTEWHDDLPRTAFTEHITGAGGQQFRYDDLRPGRPAPFSRFYTSNVSVKRRFLQSLERVFSPHYPCAAFEDTELGYRLHLRGLALYYHPAARAAHWHHLPPAHFVCRQERVGRMLTVMALQRPDFVPDYHRSWLRALEWMRRQPELRRRLDRMETDDREPLRSWLAHFEELLAFSEIHPEAAPPGDEAGVKRWIEGSRWRLWESINELALRRGMAMEWAQGDADLERQALRWVTMNVLPKLQAPQLENGDAPLLGVCRAAGLVYRIPLAARAARFILRRPEWAHFSGWAVRTPPGRALKRWLFAG